VKTHYLAASEISTEEEEDLHDTTVQSKCKRIDDSFGNKSCCDDQVMMASINFVFKHFQPYAHPSLQHFVLVKNGDTAILRSLVSLEMFLAYQKEGKRREETRVFTPAGLAAPLGPCRGRKKREQKKQNGGQQYVVPLHERRTIPSSCRRMRGAQFHVVPLHERSTIPTIDREDTSNRDLKIRRGKGTKESHGRQWLQFVF
jgi:hypothetical protein